ncbi:MAG: hypothetical protein Q9222_004181 [Ikaeria aurantiellina]
MCLGEQRYKFKNETVTSRSTDLVAASDRSGSHERQLVTVTPTGGLSNALTTLTGALIKDVDPTLDIKYQLPWNFGGFLMMIPQHLGSSAALDSASNALVTAHSQFCMGTSKTSSQVVVQYARALKVLRLELDDSAKARSSELLCAVMVLMIAQVFEALTNDRIQFTPEEWKTLVGEEIDPTATDGKWFQGLAKVPDLMQRCKSALNRHQHSVSQLLSLQYEARSLLQRFEAVIEEFRGRMERYKKMSDTGPLTDMIKAHHLRTLGLGLSAGIMLNTILGRLDAYDQSLNENSSHWSQEINQLAEAAIKYRPLGSLAFVLCLSLAWVGAADAQGRQWSETLLADYNLACLGNVSPDMHSELEKTRRRFTLTD